MNLSLWNIWISWTQWQWNGLSLKMKKNPANVLMLRKHQRIISPQHPVKPAVFTICRDAVCVSAVMAGWCRNLKTSSHFSTEVSLNTSWKLLFKSFKILFYSWKQKQGRQWIRRWLQSCDAQIQVFIESYESCWGWPFDAFDLWLCSASACRTESCCHGDLMPPESESADADSSRSRTDAVDV